MRFRTWQRRTFLALEVPEYRVLWLGSLMMFVGIQVLMIAQGVLAFDLTGTNRALGAVTFGFAIPMLLLSLWGGVVADRFPKRRLLLIAQSALALNAGWLAVMVATDLVEFWMLPLSSVVMGASFSFIGPARMAFTSDLVGRDRLANAIALQQLSMRSTQVFGPAFAGVIISIAVIGIAGAYFVVAVGFTAAVVSMLWLPAGEPAPRDELTTPVEDIAAGIRYVRANKAIGVLILTAFVVIAIGFSFEAFMVAIAKDVFDAGNVGFGALSAFVAVGAVVAATAVAGFVDHKRAMFWQAVMAVAFGVALALMGVAPVFWMALIVAVFLGALSSGFQTLNSSLVMTLTEPAFQGRVMSINMLGFSMFGFAALPMGFLADAIGLRETLMLQGVALVIAVLTISLLAASRGVSARVDPRGPEAELATGGS